MKAILVGAAAALAAAVIAALLPVFSYANSACAVTPNPVSLATDTQFTVTASGATPFDSYEVTDQQQGHHKQDEDRVWLGSADAAGNITANVPVQNGALLGGGWKPYGLWPGDVSVKVIHYQQGGSGSNKGAAILAACSFTVVG